MIYLLLLAYLALLAYTIVRILLETDSTPKTLAYLLLVVALPVAGVFIYFAFAGTDEKRGIFIFDSFINPLYILLFAEFRSRKACCLNPLPTPPVEIIIDNYPTLADYLIPFVIIGVSPTR
jgi:hypothetical protein